MALSSRLQTPSQRLTASRGARRALVVRAAETTEAPAAPAAAVQPPPVLEWPVDNETVRDIFSFSGPLAERLNGRAAMLGFVGIASAELSSQATAAEQLGDDIVGWGLLVITLTLASVFPKLVSGNSLEALHAAATSDNLKGEGISQGLVLFDQSVEMWTGRLAMLGIAGLLVLEGVQGKPFF